MAEKKKPEKVTKIIKGKIPQRKKEK